MYWLYFAEDIDPEFPLQTPPIDAMFIFLPGDILMTEATNYEDMVSERNWQNEGFRSDSKIFECFFYAGRSSGKFIFLVSKSCILQSSAKWEYTC